MSKETKVAFHGTRADPDTLKQLGGILPRVGWQKPELATKITEMPGNVQNLIWSYVGPKLRGTSGQKGGQGDADPNLSVSLTWSPRVACFFPPEGIDTYIYAVDVDGLACKDVDSFGLLCGVDRQYMKEIAVSNVQWPRILGYCTLRRWDPPGQIEKVAGHQFTKVLVGGFKLLEASLAQAITVYQEIWDAVPQGGGFGITDNRQGIAGTFHTDDSIGSAKKKHVRKLSS